MDESDSEHAPGSGTGTGQGPNASDVSAGFIRAIQALNIQAAQPAMYDILTKLASVFSSVSITTQDLEQRQKALLIANRKHKMEAVQMSVQANSMDESDAVHGPGSGVGIF